MSVSFKTTKKSKNQIDEEIKKSQIKFIEIKEESSEINIGTLKDVCLELMNNIALLYYPDSKRPLGELTIKEILLLDQYLVDKIDDILNKLFFTIYSIYMLKYLS